MIWRIAHHIKTRTTTCRRPRSAVKQPVLCPVGIRIFADALMNVARCNGLDPAGRSWRHGTSPTGSPFSKGSNGAPNAKTDFSAG